MSRLVSNPIIVQELLKHNINGCIMVLTNYCNCSHIIYPAHDLNFYIPAGELGCPKIVLDHVGVYIKLCLWHHNASVHVLETH